MEIAQIITNGENAWPDIIDKINAGKFIDAMSGSKAQITFAGLPSGTVGGFPTVTIRIDLPDGRVLLTETTLALFLTAADTLRAYYGDVRISQP